jgi:hypothetical protein
VKVRAYLGRLPRALAEAALLGREKEKVEISRILLVMVATANGMAPVDFLCAPEVFYPNAAGRPTLQFHPNLRERVRCHRIEWRRIEGETAIGSSPSPGQARQACEGIRRRITYRARRRG